MYRFKLGSEFKLCGCACFYPFKGGGSIAVDSLFIVALDICRAMSFLLVL